MTQASTSVLCRRCFSRLALAFVLLAMVWSAYSRHRCFFPEQRVYWNNFESHKLDQWFHERHAGKEVPFPRFTTEAGYSFWLWVVRHLGGDYAPFLLNAALLSVLFGIWLYAGRACAARPTARFWIPFLLAAGWAVLPKLQEVWWQLLEPHRDLSGHVLGFAALALVLRSARARRTPSPLAWLAIGWLTGFAAWHRIPDGLFVCPTMLFAVQRRAWRGLVFTGAGFLIGIAPLLAQSALSSRDALSLPQMDNLMPAADAAGPGSGWRPANFLYGVPRLAQRLNRLFGWFGLLLAVLPLLRPSQVRRGPGLVAVAALVFFSFYSCFGTYADRYNIVLYLLVLLLAGLGAAQCVTWLLVCLPRRWIRRSRLVPPTLAVLATVWALVVNPGDACAASGLRSDLFRFREWFSSRLPPSQTATVWAAHPSVRLWVRWWADCDVPRWPFRPDKSSPSGSAPEPLQDRPDLFLNIVRTDGMERVSWVREVLTHSYDLQPLPPDFPLTGGLRIRAYAVRPRTAYTATILLTNSTAALFLRMPVTVTAMTARVSGDREESRSLAPGLQCWLPSERGGHWPETGIRLTSESPLSRHLEYWTPAAGQFVLLDFSRLDTLADARQWLAGFNRRFSTYPDWWRDYGGLPGENYTSLPRYELQPESRVRLPSLSGDARNGALTVYAYLTFFGSDSNAVRRSVESIKPDTREVDWYETPFCPHMADVAIAWRLSPKAVAEGWLPLPQPAGTGTNTPGAVLHALGYAWTSDAAAEPPPMPESGRWYVRGVTFPVARIAPAATPVYDLPDSEEMSTR